MKRKYGLFGEKVVPTGIFASQRAMAMEIGAIIGRAQPELIEPAIRSHSIRPRDDEVFASRRKIIMDVATQASQRMQVGGTFNDLPDELPTIPFVSAQEAVDLCVLHFLIGMEFGRSYPDETVMLVQKKFDDPLWRGFAAVTYAAAGLGAPSHSYEEWEEDILRGIEQWKGRMSGATRG